MNNTTTLSLRDAFFKAEGLLKEGKYQESLNLSAKILEKAPNDLNLKHMIAICLIELENYPQAEHFLKECYDQVKDNEGLCFNIARLYSLWGKVKPAMDAYNATLQINPNNIGALNNLGNIYNEQGNSDIAIKCFEKILEIDPNKHFAYNNIALIYKKAGMLKEALANILKSIEIEPDAFEAQHNAALIYCSMGANVDACKYYENALKLQPDNNILVIEYHDVLSKICDWERAAEIEQKVIQFHKDNENLPVLSNWQKNQNSEKTLKASIAYTDSCIKAVKEAHQPFEIEDSRKNKKGKIRIGYMSSDIKDHPVSHLMKGVFKNHNKDEFELYLYSFSAKDNTGYKEAIESYCDKFIDVAQYSNYETARRIYDDKIDILIDLNGHTGSARIESLYLKPAPVQVNYLGYIGSMGADFIDYIITDEIVTPPEHQKYYLEKFVYMPDCYQANDNELEIYDGEITKESEGLPEDKFIFCSFNQTYKIEPQMFDVWMNILKRVPDSVLWLYKGSIYLHENTAPENLKKEAKKRGVDPERLIFAEGIPIAKHLKRIGLADLALDTRLYNGGTVTSQTLWAGTPVVTLEGWHFASRMATSILNAVGLPELVTKDKKQYEDLAVELANNPDKLQQLKKKLAANKKSKPLFNTQEFTRNLERAYKKMWENYQSSGEIEQIKLSAPKQMEMI